MQLQPLLSTLIERIKLTLKISSFNRFPFLVCTFFYSIVREAKCDFERTFARNCHVTDTNAKYIMVILTPIVVLKKLHKDWLQQFR